MGPFPRSIAAVCIFLLSFHLREPLGWAEPQDPQKGQKRVFGEISETHPDLPPSKPSAKPPDPSQESHVKSLWEQAFQAKHVEAMVVFVGGTSFAWWLRITNKEQLRAFVEMAKVYPEKMVSFVVYESQTPGGTPVPRTISPDAAEIVFVQSARSLPADEVKEVFAKAKKPSRFWRYWEAKKNSPLETKFEVVEPTETPLSVSVATKQYGEAFEKWRTEFENFRRNPAAPESTQLNLKTFGSEPLLTWEQLVAEGNTKFGAESAQADLWAAERASRIRQTVATEIAELGEKSAKALGKTAIRRGWRNGRPWLVLLATAGGVWGVEAWNDYKLGQEHRGEQAVVATLNQSAEDVDRAVERATDSDRLERLLKITVEAWKSESSLKLFPCPVRVIEVVDRETEVLHEIYLRGLRGKVRSTLENYLDKETEERYLDSGDEFTETGFTEFYYSITSENPHIQALGEEKVREIAKNLAKRAIHFQKVMNGEEEPTETPSKND